MFLCVTVNLRNKHLKIKEFECVSLINLIYNTIFPIVHSFQQPIVEENIESLNVAKFHTDDTLKVVNQSPRRIIAVGDLHGDYEQTLKVLKMTKILDEKEKWIGKNGILVQT
ncbi:3676_t:CDS:2, partial [Scutellospora calospora]